MIGREGTIKTAIYTCNFHQPQANFSATGNCRRNLEAEFIEHFARVYQRRFQRIHHGTTGQSTLFTRELPVPGHGIADLVVLNWKRQATPHNPDSSKIKRAGPTIRAFEAKLSGWRKGLMQAHRYRYFSHTAILVVPHGMLKNVIARLQTFQALRIGLWGFNPDTQRVTRVYTPRPKQPPSTKHQEQALAKIRQAVPSRAGLFR